MTHSYKPGDVIVYACDGNGEAIIDTISGGWLNLLAWRSSYTPNKWIQMDGSLDVHDPDVKPHPDPDRIWSEFAAWRLTGGGD
jgi:hypothetical protein